jgi:hypothetical protein
VNGCQALPTDLKTICYPKDPKTQGPKAAVFLPSFKSPTKKGSSGLPHSLVEVVLEVVCVDQDAT